ncbi:MAG: VanZ family protein [Rhodocyclaceae bacterium]|nr:VanZ family protein [Rhodocyclaceae bacterium]
MAEAGGFRVGAVSTRPNYLFLGWLAYIVFVIYGSLVPLDFQPLPFDQAMARFKQIPMLQLGVESRADWVANGALYVPVGFLTVALFGSWVRPLLRLPLLIGVALFSFGLAVSVEFAQVFFPPRTVSLNDIIAEWIGSVLGIVLAMYWTDWFHRLLVTLSGKVDQAIVHGLQAYVVAYLAFSFFPYDFLLSATELTDKFGSDAWGVLLAGQGQDRGMIALAAKLWAEVLAVIPFGLMLGRSNAARRMPITRHAWLLGGLLGLLIEAVQFFIFSGITQGASLLTRLAGVYFGAVLWRERQQLRGWRLAAARAPIFPLLVLLYLLALVAVNGWFDHAWRGLDAARHVLASTRFLPFYYHYYTTEQAALISFASVMLMYAPLGVLAWLRGWTPMGVLWLAAVAAICVEASKLFLAGMSSDPTNVLIAAGAAWMAVHLLERLQRQHDPASPKRIGSAVHDSVNTDSSSVRSGWAVFAVLGLSSWVAFDFPVWSAALAFALLCYGLLLWFKPDLLWVAVPAALPLLDLAPWSGRFYLDEFDFLILISLVVGYARTSAMPQGYRRNDWSLLFGALLALTVVVGVIRGLLPVQMLDANTFTNYYSPFNSLRVAKGALWALLLFALIPRFTASGRNIRNLFAAGMVIGLAGTIAIVIWERMAFPGLLNFADVYRVTGPFSQMHTGGADLEVFLAAAIPFAIVMLVSARSFALRIGAGIVILGATYALMVTFSRAGYAGFAVAAGVAILFATKAKWFAGSRLWRWIAPGVAVAAALAIAVPIYTGSFAQERLSRSGADLTTRMAHWRDTLAMRDAGLMTELFGMGLGRFPETHYWRSAEPKAGGYRLEREGDNTYLRLGAGYPLYVEQIVATEPQREYTLQLSMRSSRPDAAVTFSLCEKWLLTSGQCVFQTVGVAGAGQEWQQHEFRLASGDVGVGKGVVRPPVKLSFYNASAVSVDIDNVQLVGPDDAPLLSNGDLQRGMDRWFFSVDQDLPWHVWSMPVAVLFDLGWFGLLVLGAVLLFALMRLAQASWKGDATATASLAALAGILVIASVDTVIDAPRFLLLLLLFLFVMVNARVSNDNLYL